MRVSGKGLQQLLPLFSISIALHIAVLLWLVPKFLQPSRSQSFTEVEITDLVQPKPSIPSTPPQSQPAAKPDPPKPTPENTTPARSTPQVPTPPTPTPVPTPRSTLTSTKSTPTPAPTPTPTPTPTATPTPSSSTNAISDFFNQLVAGSGLEPNSTPPDSKLFDNPSLFFDGVTLTPVAQAKLKPDVVRAIAIEHKPPVQVYIEILVTQAQKSNFQVAERGSYGKGTVYEVKQGTNVWYFNLVPTKDLTGTIIIVWQRDPSVPVQ